MNNLLWLCIIAIYVVGCFKYSKAPWTSTLIGTVIIALLASTTLSANTPRYTAVTFDNVEVKTDSCSYMEMWCMIDGTKYQVKQITKE